MRLSLPPATYRDSAALAASGRRCWPRQRVARSGIGRDGQRIAARPADQRQHHADRKFRSRAGRPDPEHRLLEFRRSALISRQWARACSKAGCLNATTARAPPPVVAINQTMAKIYWPHESALGHRRAKPARPGKPMAHHRGSGRRYQECAASTGPRARSSTSRLGAGSPSATALAAGAHQGRSDERSRARCATRSGRSIARCRSRSCVRWRR